jgi:hypothetical protein
LRLPQIDFFYRDDHCAHAVLLDLFTDARVGLIDGDKKVTGELLP